MALYNPVPPRVWSRVQSACVTDDNTNLNNNKVFMPLTRQIVSQGEANIEKQMFYKGNILQYKGNSFRLTKTQKYTQLAKGLGPNRKKVFATQTQTYTNPNITGLLRVNYQTYKYPNTIVGAPNNISGPFQYGENPFDCSNNDIQDGGNLVCGTYANPCSGEIIKRGFNPINICFPSYCSNVPGAPIELCWNEKIQTWFPKQRYTMNNSTDKWPEGYKGFVSAITPTPPILTISNATISWTIGLTNCLPISSYNIYLNNAFYISLQYQFTNYTFNSLTTGNYTIYITSVSSTIESLPSNEVNLTI